MSTKQWQIAPAAPAEFISSFSQYPPVLAQLLYTRGLRTELQIEHFLHPELQIATYDPFLFRNMEAAIMLLISHIKVGHDIVICGDYDADGVTSSALLAEAIRTLKGKVDVWIPSRFGEGYGLNKKIIEELNVRGVKLLITVDNGIRAKAEVEYALSLGIEVIVTDHHEGPPDTADLPNCHVINPILEEETYPYKYLCGAGVAYKFAAALIERSTLSVDDKAKLTEHLVDLASVGTISDCVSLLGENRLIVKQGLELINKQPRLGLKALMDVAKVEVGAVTEWSVGWQITPRLNVAGRLDHANTAYRLLATSDAAEARRLAEELNAKNVERQGMTEAIVTACADIAATEQADEKILIMIAPDILEGGEPWSEGIIGLVAGRLAERFSKPCFVIAQSEGKIKGSGRSIEQYDLGGSLEVGKEFLERFGGHKMACGFTVKSLDDLDGFIDAMRAAAEEKLAGIDLAPLVKIDAELDLNSVTDVLLETLEKFVPYGTDNPEPKFVSRNVMIEDIMTMGAEKKHIKFRLGGMWALAFSRAEEYKDYKAGERIDLVYTVCFNIFNNRREVQLKIVDLKRS